LQRMYVLKSFFIIVCCFVAMFSRAQDTTKPAQQVDTTTATLRTPQPQQQRQVDSPRNSPANNNTTTPPPAETIDIIEANSIDTLAADSLTTMPAITDSTVDTSSFYKYRHPYLNFNGPAVYSIMQLKAMPSTDFLFYGIVLCVLFIGAIRAISPKYINSVFKLLRQPALQKQTKDQSQQQSNISAWLLNIFFVISTALFIAVCINKYYISPLGFTTLFLYASAIIALAYIAKFFVLAFAGWIFNIKEITNSYTFIEMLINKIIGMVLLPFIIVTAFAMPAVATVAATAGVCVIGLFMLYRYIIAVTTLKRFAKVNGFHFFIYLCAVEIAPALIIIKATTQYFG